MESDLREQAKAALKGVEDCLNEVHSRLLDKRESSPFVTRFPEKSLLTHKCMNLCAPG